VELAHTHAVPGGRGGLVASAVDTLRGARRTVELAQPGPGVAPVFVDPTGRRARVWAVLGGIVGGVAVLYVAALVFSLLGIPGVP